MYEENDTQLFVHFISTLIAIYVLQNENTAKNTHIIAEIQRKCSLSVDSHRAGTTGPVSSH